MSGASPRTIAGRAAVATAANTSRRAYELGDKGIKTQQGILEGALNEGEFGFTKDAYSAARTILGDAAATSERSGLAQSRALGRQAAGGGNMAASQSNPQEYGAKIAQSLFSTRVGQATGAIEQMDKTLGFMTGQGQEAGSQSLRAMGNQIGSIPFMRQYDPTYSNIVAGLNAGGALYGMGTQAGWFNSRPQIPQGQGSFSSMTANHPGLAPNATPVTAYNPVGGS